MRLTDRATLTGTKRSGEIRCSGSTTRRLRSMLYLAVIVAVVAFGAHATDTANGGRYDKLSHSLMCPCGCNQLLGECNHVGCPDSDKMRSQLAASIDHGDDDTTIFRSFQDEYGPTALAAPMFTGLNQFSWWLPPIVLLLGIGGVFVVVRRWRPRAVAMPTPATDPHTLVLEHRIRMETGGDLRRESGGDSL
jgi:cytochrome c-type biogenesis protein CcmH/NrfF